jgi:hypothetical protein
MICVYLKLASMCLRSSISSSTHDEKNTTEKPIQLATTPIAEYELMNMSGRNSKRAPKISEWPSEQ